MSQGDYKDAFDHYTEAIKDGNESKVGYPQTGSVWAYYMYEVVQWSMLYPYHLQF